MNVKRTLIETLPPGVKRLLSVPYDFYQTTRADRQFSRKTLPSYETADDAPDHIVCVVVDALRADFVDEETTPFLSSLNGTDAVTPGAWTFPAVSSMLSGVYPHEHGAMKRNDGPDESEGLTLPPRMDAGRETITEALAGAGYDTYGGFGHDTPFVALAGRFGTHELYHKVTSDASDVLWNYLDWVDGRDRTFAFLHLADPHIPVDPPRAYWDAHDVDSSIANIENWDYTQTVDCDDVCRRYREHRRRLYRASVDYIDDLLSEFDQELTSRLADPLLVVTSDHGEAMWEHLEYDVEHFDGTGCVDHGGAPYEQLARVPLLTNADWNFEGHTSLIDLAPTFARLAGIDGPEMTGIAVTETKPEDRMVIVEGSLNGYEKKAIYFDQYKLIVSKGDDVEEGYSLPEEQRKALPKDIRERMEHELPPWPDGSISTTEVSGVVEERLNQLGYK